MKMYNDFINFPCQIPVRKSLDESLAIIKPFFNGLKRSMRPYGSLYAFNVLANMPYLLPRYLLLFLTHKYHMFFTNLQATKTELVWMGKKQTGSFYYCTGVCNTNCAMSFCTLGKLMSISCYADEYGIEDPKNFIDMFVS